MKFLEIHQVKNTCQIEPSNILRVQAKSNYCKIYFFNQLRTMVVSTVLHKLQERLPANMFIRVHRSHLVNRQYIKQVSGTHTKTAELTNGEYIPVSRRKQALVE